MHAVGHAAVTELVDELVHHRLHHAGGVGAGDIAVQPALSVGDHGHRVGRAADDEAGVFQSLDQRLDLGLAVDHVFDVGTDGETHVAVGELVTDVAQLAKGEHIEDTLSARLDGPDVFAGLGDVTQHAGAGMLVVLPHAEVPAHHRMHVLEAVRATGFNGRTHGLCL